MRATTAASQEVACDTTAEEPHPVDLGLRQIRSAQIVGVSQRPEVHPVFAATLFLGINKK
jgi:hypothetical protein